MLNALAETFGGFAYRMTRALEYGVTAEQDEWNVAIELVRYDDVGTLRLDDLQATRVDEDDGTYVRVEQVPEERPDDAPTVAVHLPVNAVQQEAGKRNEQERRHAARTVETVPRKDVVDQLDNLAKKVREQAEERGTYADEAYRFDGDDREEAGYYRGEKTGLLEAARQMAEYRRIVEGGGRDDA